MKQTEGGRWRKEETKQGRRGRRRRGQQPPGEGEGQTSSSDAAKTVHVPPDCVQDDQLQQRYGSVRLGQAKDRVG